MVIDARLEKEERGGRVQRHVVATLLLVGVQVSARAHREAPQVHEHSHGDRRSVQSKRHPGPGKDLICNTTKAELFCCTYEFTNFETKKKVNVYQSARRRKLRMFDDFVKRAVLIVPSDDEYKERLKKSEAADAGKEIPASLINDMKANFSLPHDTEFDSIEYADLAASETDALIEKYKSEGAKDRVSINVAKRLKIKVSRFEHIQTYFIVLNKRPYFI